jgi:hypothetical protein
MTQRRAVAWGLAAAASWIALAAVSGAWSPLARQPLLDGLIPGAAYRWVEPPPELAAANQPPSDGRFELGFRAGESEADVVFTPDDQVTVVVPQGAVADGTARRLVISLEPTAPSAVAPLPGELEPFGNVVRLEATVEPGGPVEAFDAPLTAVLVYPATPNLHATQHELMWSPDGETWSRLDTTDSVAQQQAQAEVEAPGLLVVGGVPSASPGSSGDATDGRTNTLSTILLVLAGASLLIGIALLVRGRGAER